MEWENKLIKKGILNSPVVEMTPVIWKGKLMIAESWCWGEIEKPFVLPDVPPKPSDDHVIIRDVETNKIVSKCMEGHGLASAFVWNDAFYVFAVTSKEDEGGEPGDIYMSMSQDLDKWTEPRVAIARNSDENLYNESVCYDGKRFMMTYETNDPAYPPFTIKFAASDDLKTWTKIPDAIYGTDRYTACPALRYVAGYCYMLYLERPTSKWWFETWLTRSKDLLRWEDAPRNPVIVPDPSQDVYFPHPDSDKECNASDADLVEWQGKTRVYFTGGNQHGGGFLQYAEFDGTMQEFFESYYM